MALRCTVLRLVLAAIIALTPTTATAAERTITITVTVLDPAGAPIENIGVEAGGLIDGDFGLTNLNGIIDLQMDVADDETVVRVRLWNGVYHEKTVEETLNNRFTEIAVSFWARPRYFVQPQPNIDNYALTIQTEPAVTLSLTATDEQGVPVASSGLVWTTLVGLTGAPAGETMRLAGVRRSHPARLVLARIRGEQHIFELDAATTAADANLGPIAIPALPRDASLHLTVAGAADEFSHTGLALEDAVALVSADFDVVLTFPLNAAGVALHDENSPPIPVPSGTWWIVPGAVTPDLTMAVYDALRAGGAVALDAAGVPKVTIAPGEAATVIINAPAARDAIYAATGGPPAPDAP